MELKNKIVGIIGYSRTGKAVAEFVQKRGGKVKVSELSSSRELEKELIEKGYEYEIGKNSFEFLKDCDLIVISPGVPSKSSFVLELEEKGKDIISEIEFASYFIESKIIGITGSNGKSTVTSMVYHILKESGVEATIGGNIGIPLIKFAEENSEYFVVELSSFQLEKIKKFKPFISVLLNITPDHLDRYSNFEDYAIAKFNIFKNQQNTDFAVLNIEDEYIKNNLNTIKASKVLYSIEKENVDIYTKNNKIIYKDEEVLNFSDIPLLGIHNIENTMAVVGVMKIIGLKNSEIKEGIKTFKGLEHRTELCGEIGGVKFINDSKATNIDATYKALISFNSPIILILGGKDKGGDFTVLNDLIKSKVKKLILIGAAREKIKKQLDKDIEFIEVNTMEEAVRTSYSLAEKGDLVLLSPACASFDMYKNFEERGRDFKNLVKMLKKEIENG